MAAIARRQGQSYAKCRPRMQQSYVAWKRLVNGNLRQIRPKPRRNGGKKGTRPWDAITSRRDSSHFPK
jgi:hypothetical protein